RQGTLFTQDFDPVRLELSGNPVTVTENLRVQVLSASRAGPIVYRADALGDGPFGSAVLPRQREFIWFDRSGSEIRKVGREFSGGSEPSLSPDGSRVALWRSERECRHLVARNRTRRVQPVHC